MLWIGDLIASLRDIFLIKYSFILVIAFRLSTHIYILISFVKL